MSIYRDGNSIQTSEINEIRKLIANRNVKDLLEIGTYRGNVVFSVYDLVVGEHEGSITSVDIKQSNDYNKLNKLYIEEHDMKEVHLSAIGANKFFAKNNKKFDMIILDGGQSYDQIKSDIENSLDAMIDGGIVVMYRYRNSLPVQQVVNEIDGGLYNKELIHTVHHLMTISKKESVRVLLKYEVSRDANEDEVFIDETESSEMKEETKKDD